MADLLSSLADARALTDLLNPSAVESKFREYHRGGFPAQSMPEPGHPTGTIVRSVGGDRFDKELSRKLKGYERALNEARAALDRALVLQYWFLVPTPQNGTENVYGCKNPRCPNLHERKDALCARCRQWKSRNDTDYPYKHEIV